MAMSSGSERGSRRTQMSEINVTPLVDVMLVLLIMFMVTAPLSQQGIEVQLPETANSGVTPNEDPFVVVIRDDRKLFIGTAEISMASLQQKVAAIFSTRQDKQVYIQADKSVSYGVVAEAMGEIKSAGITNISLVTQPKSK